MPDYPAREELDDEHTWDLTRIYGTPADWEAAADELADRAAALRTREGPTDSPAALAGSLEASESALVTKNRLELYAELRRNEDTTDDDRRDRRRRARRLATDVDEAVQAVRRRIQRDAPAVREHRERPALDGWRDYLDDLLAGAPHTRDASVEAVIAAFEPVVESGTDTVLAVTTDDFEAPTVGGPDGEDFEVDGGSYSAALDSPDRAFRRRAHEAFLGALGDYEHALAAAVAEKVEANAALATVRNYDSVREMALSRASYPDTGMCDSFPASAHDAVIENVRDHFDAYHDLLESRRACLGVETLRPWDASAPLVDDEVPELDYAAVCEHVLAAVEPLGAEYRDRLAAVLDERRVDVFPTRKKRTDITGYCPSNPETGAFVLANFRGDLRTAFVLAHELGHAMHAAVLRDAGPPRYATCPQPVSEVPSLLHELLLAEHLHEEGETALTPFVRERRANVLAGNVYRAGRSAAFLHEMYRLVEDGYDLSPDRLAETYADCAAAFRGPVEAADGGCEWRREAYARQPYHSYQYVTGTAAAVSIHRRIQSGKLATGAYRDFLGNAGRRDSVSSFESLGIDVTASDPYERVADELDRVREARLD
jgi:oligoendopeptidase F